MTIVLYHLYGSCIPSKPFILSLSWLCFVVCPLGVFPLIKTSGAVDSSGNSRLSFFLLAVDHINNKTDGIADDILPNVEILTAVGDSKRSASYGFLAAYYMLTEAFQGNLTQVPPFFISLVYV